MLWRRSLITACCAIAVLVLGAVVTGPAAAQPAGQGQQAQPPAAAELTLINPGPLTVDASEGKDTAIAYLTLENPGKTGVEYGVRFLATSSKAVEFEDLTSQVLPRGAVRRVALSFSGLKALNEAVSGQIVISGSAPTISETAEVQPAPQPEVAWPPVVIFVSFFAALLLSLAIVPSRPGLGVLKTPAPGPKLSFESWATSLTAAGAIVGTVIGGVVFPSFPQQISKQALLNLGVFFAAVVVVAPFVFEALRLIRPGKGEEEKGRVGTNLGLLIACALTMWGVLGELGSLSLLVWELATSDVERSWMLGCIALIAVLAARYFLISVYYLVRKEWAAEEAEAAAVTAPAPAVSPPSPPPPPGEYTVPRRGYRFGLGPGVGVDMTGIDRLRYTIEESPTVTITTDEDARTAAIAVPAPAVAAAAAAPAPAPERWSLL